MPGSTASRTLVNAYKIQHWLKFPEETAFIRVTEMNSAEVERQDNSYEPEYIDYEVQPKFQLKGSEDLSIEVDAMAPGGAQKFFAKYEDTKNVPVEYARTIGYDFENEKECPQTALVAKHAAAKLNVSPMTQEANGPIKMPATITIDEAYDYGTFDATTGTYTPASSSPSDDGEEDGQGTA